MLLLKWCCTGVAADFVETEVEINFEAAVIDNNEAGQKGDAERRSTKMSGLFAFSLWMWHGFLLAFLGLWKLSPMVGW